MKIKVADFGEYDMPDNFTFREMNFIKKITGLRAGELYPALNAGDSDVYAAFALTAIRRAHSDVTEDDVMELHIDEIELIVEDSDKEAAAKDSPPSMGGPLEPKSDDSPPVSTEPMTEIHAIHG